MIRKKNFAIAALDPEHDTIIVHVVALNVNLAIEVHPSIRALIAHLKVDETHVKVLSKYADFANVFLLKLAAEPPKHTRINDHVIEFVDD